MTTIAYIRIWRLSLACNEEKIYAGLKYIFPKKSDEFLNEQKVSVLTFVLFIIAVPVTFYQKYSHTLVGKWKHTYGIKIRINNLI